MTGTVLRDEAVFPLCGHRFFCCHGHRYHVNYGIQTLSCAAYEKGCDIALYGHTHIPYDSFGEAVAAGGSGAVAEAIEALASLGYSNSEIMPVIKKIEGAETKTSEEILKQALRLMMK